MLDSQSFDHWCDTLQLTQAARSVVEQIRQTEPSRRVQGYRKNVSGSYPSRKMRLTIQFESHRNELARIYELEHDPNVLEYYDQPPTIELVYAAKSGRRNRHQYTPDFFVIRTHSAGWEECKTESDLIQLSQSSPHRYQRGADGKWHCPPGEAYAAPFGFSFKVCSDADINWVFQQNIIWLEDYFSSPLIVPALPIAQSLLTTVRIQIGITLAELFHQHENISRDDIYALIATGQLYVDLNAARLAEPEQVRVFLNQEVACAYQRIIPVPPGSFSNKPLLSVAIGMELLWDSQVWTVANSGMTTTGLLHPNSKLIELPNAVLETLLKEGKITSAHDANCSSPHPTIQAALAQAKPEDIVEANRRYAILLPYLSDTPLSFPSSTIRRWRDHYRKAETLYGSGYIGLLPKHGMKGNHSIKMDEGVRELMLQFIEDHYETPTQRGKWRVYQAFVAACKAHEPPLTPPSHVTFFQAIKQRAGVAQTQRREGHRAAIQKEPFYWELKLTTPRHGSRPFEIVHIDHTQLDIELVSSLQSLEPAHLSLSEIDIQHSLGRPWATFMVDAYSRRLLAVYLTFDAPSYRSCMMAIRICVQRFQRLPQMIVVDNGAEFHSHYFEQLLAYYVCTKKHRPPAHARFGSVIERLFGTANTQLIHELQGNTQITRQVRQVTKAVNPRMLAVWTLPDLYTALCQWAYEIYDQREHPTLGQRPRDRFETGLVTGGSRCQRHVAYDEIFQMLTLPVPERGKRKVQPSRGVKIHNIYYWSNAFRDPATEQSMVEVRYDPFDVSVAYALVQGQWVKCLSAYYLNLQGRSEREIQLISAELAERKRINGQTLTITDKELVEFLNSQQAKEGQFLEQRLRALEHHKLLATQLATESPETANAEIGSYPASSRSPNQPISLPSAKTEKSSETEMLPLNVAALVMETPAYYGEF
jgi:putative transposase